MRARIKQDNYTNIKRVLSIVPPKSKGIGDIYRAFGISNATGSRINRSKDFEEYRVLASNPKPKPTYQQELVNKVSNTIPNNDIFSRLNEIEDTLILVYKIVSAIKPKYLNKEQE